MSRLFVVFSEIHDVLEFVDIQPALRKRVVDFAVVGKVHDGQRDALLRRKVLKD